MIHETARKNLLDKRWRLNNLYKIRSKDRGICTFKFNHLQEQIFYEVIGMKPIRHFTLKTRQVGMSTFWLLWYLDDSLFKKGIITGCLAHKHESIQHLTSIIKTALDFFPGERIPLEEESKTRFTFARTKSAYIFSLEIRSSPLHNLHISEWCFCENERIWATHGACSKYTNISGETTGNGIANDGYLTWMDSQEGKNEYKSRFIPWYEHDEYVLPMKGHRDYVPDQRERKYGLTQPQIHYRRQMMGKLKNAFFVEYPETPEDAFAQSGSMFFESRKILALSREARKLNDIDPPAEQTDEYIMWEPPQPGHVYCIGADVSEGLDGDYSTFKVICLTCRQHAMAYRAHTRIDSFYRELNKWGRAYNRCLLCVERNNHGHAVLLGLSEDCHYPNLYQEVKDQPIVIDLSKPRQEPKLGWHTTGATKETMLQHLKICIEGDAAEDENSFQPEYRVRDLTFLSECLTMQRNGVKIESAQGKHDDTIIAEAIAVQMYFKLKSKMVGQSGLEKVILGAKRNYT